MGPDMNFFGRGQKRESDISEGIVITVLGAKKTDVSKGIKFNALVAQPIKTSKNQPLIESKRGETGAR